MGITATAGTVISIGGAAANHGFNETYTSGSWTPIANVSDAGEGGAEAEILVGKFIDQDYARKLKGTRDAGTMSIQVARDAGDPGYAALVAAEATPHAYKFQVELDDAPPTGTDPKNSTFHFSAIVASKRNAFNDADNIVTTTFALAISGPIIETPASAS